MSRLLGSCNDTTVAGAAILYSPHTSDPKLPARARNTQCVLPRVQCLREASYTEIANATDWGLMNQTSRQRSTHSNFRPVHIDSRDHFDTEAQHKMPPPCSWRGRHRFCFVLGRGD